MADKPKSKMDPQEGMDAVFNLVNEITQAAENQDLAGLDSIIDQLGGIATATGLEIPGISDQIAGLKQETAKSQRHFENVDAAMWAGDLKRAETLRQTGPQMDLEAMGIPDYIPDEDFEIDAEIDVGQMAGEPDLYEDIVAGKPGALDEFLKSGADPNIASGPSQHTAFLAALDAPGRSVEHVKALIAAGADVTAYHFAGDNALSWAMGYDHPDTVTHDSEIALIGLLAEHGVDPNHITDGYWTVLHRAIIMGNATQVAAVLAVGADVTICMFSEFDPQKLANTTPVMLAAPKPDVLRVLLDHGADAEKPDATGRVPLDFVEGEAVAARTRAREDDPWTIRHAQALEASAQMLRDHLGK